MRRHRTEAALAVATLLAAASGAALAEDAPAKTKFDELLDSAGLTVSGYVAASYYASNGYPANIHQFDVHHNTFQLDQAGLQVAYQPKEGFGALVDVIAGEDAKILHQAESGNASDTSYFDVRQAWVQYATGPLTLMAGKFVTLAGAEVINPTLNTNFSRSLLFFDSEPLTHTGIRGSYAATDTITVTAGINNGWNTTSLDYGSKTGEFGIAYAPASKLFSLAVNAYFGKMLPYDAERTLIDFVGTYNVTSQLSIVLNFDWDQQQNGVVDAAGNLHDASWHAGALYVNYAINDQWRVSVRGEYLDDQDGFYGPKQTLKEGTVTVGYAPAKSFELRAEFRYDKSGANTPTFFRSATATKADSDNLSEFALQAVYKFSAPPPPPAS